MAASKKLVVVDGMAYAFRSFYAIAEMSNSKGQATNAVYGFVNALRRAEKSYKPDYAVVAFDSPGGSFRDEMLKEYKGHREAPPEALVSQFPIIEEVTRLMGWHLLKMSRFEADDIMATVTRWGRKKGLEVLLMTSDKDILQLVGDGVRVFRGNPQGGSLYGPKEVEERYGVTPDQITDLLGLMGDSADNIPGVPGVGEKTAAKLLKEYGDMTGVLKAAPKIKQEKLSHNLKEFADQAKLSKKLAELDFKVPLKETLEGLVKLPPQAGLLDKLQELEFRGLVATYSASLPEQVQAAPAADTSGKRSKKNALAVTMAEAGQKAEAAWRASKIDPNKRCGIWHGGHLDGPMAFAQGDKALVLKAGDGKQALGLLKTLKKPAMFESKPIQGQMIKQGIEPLEDLLDLSIALYLINASRTARTLDEAAGVLSLELGKLPLPGQELFEPPAADLAQLAAAIETLAAEAEKRMASDKLEKLYDDLEGPLIPVLARMEVAGIAIDSAALKDLDRDCQSQMKSLEKKAMKLAGKEFNLSSPSQLAKVLFEDLKLPHTKKTKTGYSTDSDVLESLEDKHALPGVALEYRTLAKLSGTYLQALPRLVDSQDGRVHTTWNQNVAATGRLSSTDPNLQNIPIRTELGHQVRKAFVAQRKGDLILAADYSQIELRILAHYCQDAVLLKAFQDGLDIHRETAARIFGVRPEKVDSEMRGRAKVINFGVLYGMGPFRISREFKIPMAEAKKFIEQYFSRFPAVATFLEKCKEDTRRQGYCTTLLGRRRYIPEINSANRVLRESGERTATNLPIQGSAADLIKVAMYHVDQFLIKKKARSRMLLQVHDELVFEMAKEEAAWLPKEVSRIMENAMALKTPLKVGIGQGKSWYEAKS